MSIKPPLASVYVADEPADPKASAQAALALHDTVLEEGLRLIVYISNPEKKKGRTDAGANSKEMYVTGLSKYVKEYDLRKLFEPVSRLTLGKL